MQENINTLSQQEIKEKFWGDYPKEQLKESPLSNIEALGFLRAIRLLRPDMAEFCKTYEKICMVKAMMFMLTAREGDASNGSQFETFD